MHVGSVGEMYRRWVDGSNYDEVITDSINHSWWLQMKRTVELNMNSTCPKRGELGYDPAYRFYFIFKKLVHNVNCISKHAESDQCGDETTWGHGGFGEVDSGLVGRIMGKPGVSKGGQIVMVSDVNRMGPCAYLHQNKLQ